VYPRVPAQRSRNLLSAAGLGLVLLTLGRLATGETGALGSVSERVRALLAEVERDETSRPHTQRASERAHQALERAELASRQGQAEAPLIEAVALEWAEVARDLRRARQAEQASDRLELEVSALQTEIARSRAAVEQARARLGRAQQELRELELASVVPKGAPKPPAAGLPAPAPNSSKGNSSKAAP
jgi:hypothetical protein